VKVKSRKKKGKSGIRTKKGKRARTFPAVAHTKPQPGAEDRVGKYAVVGHDDADFQPDLAHIVATDTEEELFVHQVGFKGRSFPAHADEPEIQRGQR
jgi:hypothetical protein